MWIRSENDSTVRPAEIERAGDFIIVRKDFRAIEASEEMPEHWEYDEWQMTAGQYEVYQDSLSRMREQEDALVELGELFAAHDDALVELAEMIGG